MGSGPVFQSALGILCIIFTIGCGNRKVEEQSTALKSSSLNVISKSSERDSSNGSSFVPEIQKEVESNRNHARDNAYFDNNNGVYGRGLKIPGWKTMRTQTDFEREYSPELLKEMAKTNVPLRLLLDSSRKSNEAAAEGEIQALPPVSPPEYCSMDSSDIVIEKSAITANGTIKQIVADTENGFKYIITDKEISFYHDESITNRVALLGEKPATYSSYCNGKWLVAAEIGEPLSRRTVSRIVSDTGTELWSVPGDVISVSCNGDNVITMEFDNDGSTSGLTFLKRDRSPIQLKLASDGFRTVEACATNSGSITIEGNSRTRLAFNDISGTPVKEIQIGHPCNIASCDLGIGRYFLSCIDPASKTGYLAVYSDTGEEVNRAWNAFVGDSIIALDKKSSRVFIGKSCGGGIVYDFLHDTVLCRVKELSGQDDNSSPRPKSLDSLRIIQAILDGDSLGYVGRRKLPVDSLGHRRGENSIVLTSLSGRILLTERSDQHVYSLFVRAGSVGYSTGSGVYFIRRK